MLVCATGFDVSYRFPFPIIGRDGVSLNNRWGNAAEAYLTLVVDGFPNMFFVGGPNTGVNSGSLIAMYERQTAYAIKATLKLQRERLKCIEVKRAAMDDWRAHMEVRPLSYLLPLTRDGTLTFRDPLVRHTSQRQANAPFLHWKNSVC